MSNVKCLKKHKTKCPIFSLCVGVSFQCLILLILMAEKGRVSCVACRQRESKDWGIPSIVFQENAIRTQTILSIDPEYLIEQPLHQVCTGLISQKKMTLTSCTHKFAQGEPLELIPIQSQFCYLEYSLKLFEIPAYLLLLSLLQKLSNFLISSQYSPLKQSGHTDLSRAAAS